MATASCGTCMFLGQYIFSEVNVSVTLIAGKMRRSQFSQALYLNLTYLYFSVFTFYATLHFSSASERKIWSFLLHYIYLTTISSTLTNYNVKMLKRDRMFRNNNIKLLKEPLCIEYIYFWNLTLCE